MSTTISNPRGDRRLAGQPLLVRTAQGAFLALSILSICLLMPPLVSDAAGRSPAQTNTSEAAGAVLDASGRPAIAVHDYHLGHGFRGLVFPDASVGVQSRTPTVTETLMVTEVVLLYAGLVKINSDWLQGWPLKFWFAAALKVLRS